MRINQPFSISMPCKSKRLRANERILPRFSAVHVRSEKALKSTLLTCPLTAAGVPWFNVNCIYLYHEGDSKNEVESACPRTAYCGKPPSTPLW